MKFRKKPVVVEAMQYTGLMTFEMAKWMSGAECRTDFQAGTTYLVIETLEGTVLAAPSYWIIKDIQGEFYPCKQDIFKATYEEVE